MDREEFAVRAFEELPQQVRIDLPRISRCLVERDFRSLGELVPLPPEAEARIDEEIEIALRHYRQRHGERARILPVDEEALRNRQFLGDDDDPDGWHLFVPVFWDPLIGESDLKFVFDAKRQDGRYVYSSFAVYVP